nr:hypothetical protein [uncultured Kingella sp.]
MPTTLVLTRNTAEPAALHVVQINNQLIAIYETAESLSVTQAVQQTLSPADAPIRAVELEVQYRAQNIVARCVPPEASSGSTLAVVFNGTEQLDCRWQD